MTRPAWLLADLPVVLLSQPLTSGTGVNLVAFSPRGQTLASVSADGTVLAWHVVARSIARAMRGASELVTTLLPMRVMVSARCPHSRPSCSMSIGLPDTGCRQADLYGRDRRRLGLPRAGGQGGG